MKNSGTVPFGNASPSASTRRIVRTHILGTDGYEDRKGAQGAPNCPISTADRRTFVKIGIRGQRRYGNRVFLELLQHDGDRTLELRVVSGGDILRQLLNHDIRCNAVTLDLPLA